MSLRRSMKGYYFIPCPTKEITMDQASNQKYSLFPMTGLSSYVVGIDIGNDVQAFVVLTQPVWVEYER